MQQFSIKTKLWLLTIFSLIIVGLVGLTGWIGVSGTGGALERVSARMEAVNTLMGLRTWQLTAVGETRGARGWDFATFDAVQDQKEALAEAHSFFGYVSKSKQDADARMKQFFDAYAKLPKEPDEAALWKTFQEEWAVYDEINQQINNQVRDMSTATDWAVVRGKFTTLRNNDDTSLPLVQRTVVTLDKLLELSNRYATEERQAGDAAKATASGLIIAIVGGAILVLAFMSWLIVRGIVGSLNTVRRAIIQVAESNDFTASVTVGTRDETGQIAQAFNTLLQNIRTSLREVLDSAGRISGVAQQAEAAARNVSASSTSQSEAASAMASTVEEMTVSIGHISENSREALSRARDSAAAADHGTQMITRSTSEMDAIARTVGETGKTIDALGKHSDRISTITQVIKDVADQTNLLALNAAIEAARAGEQGRGFAVVADEVRKLAERTAHSAGEISEMIGDVLSSAKSAVTGMESVTGMVAGGKELSAQVADRMDVIRADTEQVTGSINEISSALNEQSEATQDIARQVEMVARMSEGNCDAAAETARISGELNTLAESLRTAANRFRV